MYRLIRWLLHKFNYELVSFAYIEFIRNKVASVRIEDGRWRCMYDSKYKYYFVYGLAENARVVVKTFKIEDYGSEEYARACAQELCDKLNEKP